MHNACCASAPLHKYRMKAGGNMLTDATERAAIPPAPGMGAVPGSLLVKHWLIPQLRRSRSNCAGQKVG